MQTLPELMNLATRLANQAWPTFKDQPRPAQRDRMTSQAAEELGELIQELRKLDGRSFRGPEEAQTADPEGELGDLMTMCLRIAHLYRLDPVKAIERTLVKLERRIQERDTNNEMVQLDTGATGHLRQ